MSVVLMGSPRLPPALRDAIATETDETLRDLFAHAAHVVESEDR